MEDKSRWSARIKSLREKIDTNCPVIYAGNWPSEHAKGWRWALNIVLSDGDGESIIDDYQTAHGKLNVALGHPFNENTMKPAPLLKECGLYIRDLEDLVRDAKHNLENDEAIERWLKG